MYACGKCGGTFAKPKQGREGKICPNCATSAIVNLSKHIQQFVREMEMDVKMSHPRSESFEDGKRWVLRRAMIRADMAVPDGL